MSPVFAESFRKEEPIIRIIITLEKGEDGLYTAYSDNPQASASGATEEEAITHYKDALRALLDAYGNEVYEDFKNKTYRVIEV